MANEIIKYLQGRMTLKHGTEAEWNLAAEKSNFIPLNKELILYDPDGTYDYYRYKLGDGSTIVNALPFEDPDPTAIKYIIQALTDEQKAQARENIGAVESHKTDSDKYYHIYGTNGSGEDIMLPYNDGISPGYYGENLGDTVALRTLDGFLIGNNPDIDSTLNGEDNLNYYFTGNTLINATTLQNVSVLKKIYPNYIYGTDEYGNQATFDWSINGENAPFYGAIARRDDTGHLMAASWDIPYDGTDNIYDIDGLSQYTTQLMTGKDVYDAFQNHPLGLTEMTQVKYNIDNGNNLGDYGALIVYGGNNYYTDIPLDYTLADRMSVTVRDYDNQIHIAETPNEDTHAASKKYVDESLTTVSETIEANLSNSISSLDNKTEAIRIKVDNTMGGKFGDSTSIAIGNCTNVQTDTYSTGNYKAITLKILELIEATAVTFSLFDINNVFPAIYDSTSGIETISVTTSIGTTGTTLAHCSAVGTAGEWILTKQQVTLTGTVFYLVITEGKAGVSTADWSTFMAGFTNLAINVNVFNSNLLSLYSNREVHLTTPVSTLTIDELVESYDSSYAQSWTISFLTGDAEPSIAIPSNITWAYAAPVYEANKRYLLSFKKLGDSYIGIWTVIG